MPNDSEARVKRTAHFSWSWRESCRLRCVVSKSTVACCHKHCRVYPTDSKRYAEVYCGQAGCLKEKRRLVVHCIYWVLLLPEWVISA